jgi:hypothetical protein
MLAEKPSLAKYLVSSNPITVNKAEIAKLFQLSETYFWEFYSTYPIKVPNGKGGSRVLRTERSETKLAEDMKVKYERIIKTLEAHKYVMRCLHADLDARKRSNTLQYLPAIEAYINGRDWEKAETLLDSANAVRPLSYGQDLI